jgi:hypothetical protein
MPGDRLTDLYFIICNAGIGPPSATSETDVAVRYKLLVCRAQRPDVVARRAKQKVTDRIPRRSVIRFKARQ